MACYTFGKIVPVSTLCIFTENVLFHHKTNLLVEQVMTAIRKQTELCSFIACKLHEQNFTNMYTISVKKSREIFFPVSQYRIHTLRFGRHVLLNDVVIIFCHRNQLDHENLLQFFRTTDIKTICKRKTSIWKAHM